MSLNRELKIISDLQRVIKRSPSYREGMVVRNTSCGSGVEIVVDGETIDISEQNLVLADASNFLAEENKNK